MGDGENGFKLHTHDTQSVQNGDLHQVCKCEMLFCKVHANSSSPELEKVQLQIFDNFDENGEG